MSKREKGNCKRLAAQGKCEEARTCWIQYGKKAEDESFFAIAGNAYKRAKAFDDRIRVLLLETNGDIDLAASILQNEIRDLLSKNDQLSAAILCEKAGDSYKNSSTHALEFLYGAAEIHKRLANQSEYERLNAKALLNFPSSLDLEYDSDLSVKILERMIKNHSSSNQPPESLSQMKLSLAKKYLTNGHYQKAIFTFKELVSSYEAKNDFGTAAAILKKLALAASVKSGFSNVWNESLIWLEVSRLWSLAGNPDESVNAQIKSGTLAMSRHMESNREYSRLELLDVLENSNKSFFITGKAGSGKSTIIREFVKRTKKPVAVVTFTGLAAVNVGGQTIHSFFRINPYDSKEELGNYHKTDARLKHLKILIIDEISMIPKDIFERIDRILRQCQNPDLPFGGVRLLLFGDYFQLPPIPKEGSQNKREYVFSSAAYALLRLENILLTSHYRQKDMQFLEILDSIRQKNHELPVALKILGTRLASNFEEKNYSDSLILTTTRLRAKELNETKLAKLPAPIRTYNAQISGSFNEYNEERLPAELLLVLKEGARVMFIQNDPDGNWVNGTLGTVIELNDTRITVKLSESGDKVVVGKSEFEKIKQVYDTKLDKIQKVVVGKMVQYPVRLAWAVTIHKSQGQTYSSVILDFGNRRPWDHGQTYVALSRCKSLEGLFLKQAIEDSDVILDMQVVDFLVKSGL